MHGCVASQTWLNIDSVETVLRDLSGNGPPGWNTCIMFVYKIHLQWEATFLETHPFLHLHRFHCTVKLVWGTILITDFVSWKAILLRSISGISTKLYIVSQNRYYCLIWFFFLNFLLIENLLSKGINMEVPCYHLLLLSQLWSWWATLLDSCLNPTATRRRSKMITHAHTTWCCEAAMLSPVLECGCWHQ